MTTTKGDTVISVYLSTFVGTDPQTIGSPILAEVASVIIAEADVATLTFGSPCARSVADGIGSLPSRIATGSEVDVVPA